MEWREKLRVEVLKLRLSSSLNCGRKKKEAMIMIMAAQPSAIESNPRDTRAAPFCLSVSLSLSLSVSVFSIEENDGDSMQSMLIIRRMVTP